MKEIKFKTNINCQNCVSAVKGFIEEVDEIDQWEVDTEHEDKILKVKGNNIQKETIIAAVEEAGFDIVHFQ